MLYLDFDGHVNPWYSAWGYFDAVGYDLDGNDTSFTSVEREQISMAWA